MAAGRADTPSASSSSHKGHDSLDEVDTFREVDSKTNEAFLLEWEPDESPVHSAAASSSEQLENTKNSARSHTRAAEAAASSSGADGAGAGAGGGGQSHADLELASISIPNASPLVSAPVLSSLRLSRRARTGNPRAGWAGDTMSVASEEQGQGGEQLEEFTRRQQELRDREPLRLCRWMTEKPGLLFCLTLAGHVISVAITLILSQTSYDILPVKFSRLPLDLRKDPDYLRSLAWSKRNSDDSIISRYFSNPANKSERTDIGEPLLLIFKLAGGNVFTKENLKLMKAVESDFYDNPDFQSSFCHLDATGSCNKPRSILRYFDGTYKHYDSTFDDPDFDNVATVLYKASTNNFTKQQMLYHLGKEAKIEANEVSSEVTRWQLFIGVPLKGYANRTDDQKAQLDKIETFILNNFKVKAEDYYKSNVGPMQFMYSSPSLLGLTIKSQVFKDMALAFGSLLFIVLFVCIQTGSLWVGLLAIFSIVASFTEANLIYRVILDYRYFGIVHVLAIFIILGIGADDVFVFFDTWKESSHHSYKSLGHRLSDCYRKASLAMLFTSLTTAIAFAISASSPFLAINSFGIFSCVLVLVNYISVVMFFPCVVVTYHLWWQKYTFCCCCPRKSPSTENATSGAPANDKRKNIIVRFFTGPYFRFITHRVYRWFILLFYAILISVSIYFVSILRVNEQQVEFLPKTSNFGQFLSLWSNSFTSTSEGGSKVLLVWGLKQQDLSTCHKSDAVCTGHTVWDDKFNLNSPTTQQALLELCKDLKALDQAQTDSLAIRRSLVNNKPEVQCFVDDMKIFYQDESDRVFPGPPTGPVIKYPPGSSFSYPITAAQMKTIMATGSNAFIYSNASAFPASFDGYFEIATSFWLFNGFRFSSNGLKKGPQLLFYNNYIGEAKTDYTIINSVRNSGSSYKYGTRLRYVAIIINTTIDGSNFGYPKGLPIRNRWEDYISRRVAILPDSLKGGFQIMVQGFMSSVWHWFKTQKTLAESAVIGVVIGICVACPLLVLATKNVFVGLLATLTICCITCSVIGVIPLAGWRLGLLESLNLVLVVGLAVDYVVHLAEGYSRSIFPDRKRRTQSALEEVGISVISGAFTSMGASVFLLGAVILFFTQFGIFMFSTIGFSILYALGMFTTLIAIIGPQGETGSLRPIWHWLTSCCRCASPPRATTSAHVPAPTVVAVSEAEPDDSGGQEPQKY